MELEQHFNLVQYYPDERRIIVNNKLTADDLIKIAASSPKGREFVLHLAKVAAGDSSSEFNETVPAMNTEQLEADKASLPSQGPGNKQNPQQQPPPEEVPVEGEMPMEAAPDTSGSPEEIGARAAQSFIGVEIMQAAMSGDPAAQDLMARAAGQVAGAVAEAVARSAGMGGAQAGGMPSEDGVPPGGGMPIEGGVAPGMAPGMAPRMAPGMAPAIATPEEELANEIVPPVAAPAAVPAVAPTGAPVPNGAPVPSEQVDSQGGEQGAIDQGKGPQTVVNPEPGVAPAPAQPGTAPAGGEITVEDVKKLLDLAKAGQI